MSAAESVAATFTTVTPGQADLVTTLAATGIAITGGYMGFTITVTNNGPDPAIVQAADSTPSGIPDPPTTFYCVGSVPAPGSGQGWCGPMPSNVSCTPPTVGSPGTLACTTTSPLPEGASMTVIMAIRVGFLFPHQGICDTATATSNTPDPNTANNTATACAFH
jgi:hypothetical protein